MLDFTDPLERGGRLEDQLRSVLDAVQEGVWLGNARASTTYVNGYLAHMLGYEVEEMLGRPARDFLDDEALHEAARRFLAGQHGGAERYELALRHRNGSRVWAIGSTSAISGPEGELAGALAFLTDITEQKRAAGLERDRNRVFEMVAHGEPLADILTQVAHTVERQRPGARCAVWLVREGRLHRGAAPGLPKALVVSLEGRPVIEGGDPAAVAAHEGQVAIVSDAAADSLVQEDRSLWLGHGLRAGWAVPVRSGQGEMVGALALYLTDVGAPDMDDLELMEGAGRLAAIAIEQRLLTEQLARQARYDALTGLPNRVLFEDRLEQAIHGAERFGRLMAVLFIDLDRFKEVNDTLGHHVGDELLQEVARRLQGCIRASDTIARMGGDEFTVVLTEVTDGQAAVVAARKLLEAVTAPLYLAGREIVVTASIGAAVYPENGVDAATLKRNADIAMYQAKGSGKNDVRCFAPEMNAAMLERLELAGELRRALAGETGRTDGAGDVGHLELHYQPQFDAGSLEPVAVEALARWRHPRRGLLAPEHFVSVAEENGLVGVLGSWVLTEACRQNAAWQAAGLTPLRVAVNVSPWQFARDDLPGVVSRALVLSGLQPRWLELEVDEALVMRDVRESAARLARLRELGVVLSVDSFGAGHSSLSYLRRLPIDALKVGRDFVAEVEVPFGTLPLVKAITAFAHSLGLDVVAQGVEVGSQLELLRGLGCDRVQGYLFSRPLEAAEFEAFLAQRPVEAG